MVVGRGIGIGVKTGTGVEVEVEIGVGDRIGLEIGLEIEVEIGVGDRIGLEAGTGGGREASGNEGASTIGDDCTSTENRAAISGCAFLARSSAETPCAFCLLGSTW